MNLDELYLKKYCNFSASATGIDQYENCIDKKHFASYSKDVGYSFNSRGFRDTEWNDDLENSIWCLGDSFTVGLGQPFEQIWPRMLARKSKKHTVNISMSGASNEWISRKTNYIIEKIAPKIIVVQWSFIGRRELNDDSLPDDKRIIHFDKSAMKAMSPMQFYKFNIDNFIACFNNIIENDTTTVIHTFIPGATTDISMNMNDTVFWDYVNANISNTSNIIFDNNQLDVARDGFHYDILTTERYTDDILKIITQ